MVDDIQGVLRPIWDIIPGAASKVRQRIGTVLNFSHTKDWRPMEAPTKSVSMSLPKRKPGGNYAAMPYADVPNFISKLSASPESIGRLALLFTIHTAARSGETRNARWSHIDFENRLWHRPAELMKMRKPHIVTLNAAAIAVLQRVEPLRQANSDLVFPGAKGSALSDMTLSKILRDAQIPYTVHGFRSSFRDWAAEQMPQIPDPVAEVALAHGVPEKVVAAYKRTEFLAMRKDLLESWAVYCVISNTQNNLGV